MFLVRKGPLGWADTVQWRIANGGGVSGRGAPKERRRGRAEKRLSKRVFFRKQKRHIKLLHIKLFPVAPVTGPPGRVSGQKDLCSLGSEDST